jgi:hypothetical protein
MSALSTHPRPHFVSSRADQLVQGNLRERVCLGVLSNVRMCFALAHYECRTGAGSDRSVSLARDGSTSISSSLCNNASCQLLVFVSICVSYDGSCDPLGNSESVGRGQTPCHEHQHLAALRQADPYQRNMPNLSHRPARVMQ